MKIMNKIRQLLSKKATKKSSEKESLPTHNYLAFHVIDDEGNVDIEYAYTDIRLMCSLIIAINKGYFLADTIEAISDDLATSDDHILGQKMIEELTKLRSYEDDKPLIKPMDAFRTQ